MHDILVRDAHLPMAHVMSVAHKRQVQVTLDMYVYDDLDKGNEHLLRVVVLRWHKCSRLMSMASILSGVVPNRGIRCWVLRWVSSVEHGHGSLFERSMVVDHTRKAVLMRVMKHLNLLKDLEFILSFQLAHFI